MTWNAEISLGHDLIYRAPRGKVILEGPDAIPFIGRMSTENLSLLAKANPLTTVFTNNKGKIIDVGFLWMLSDNQLLIVSAHPDAQVLTTWLSNYHFAEDFVIKEDSHQDFAMVLSTRSSMEGAMNYWSTTFVDGKVLNFFPTLTPPHGHVLTHEEWETIRIKALMPGFPSEENERWMPQNIGLEQFISHDKGCYIGQEVIAKAITYQKQKRTLAGAKLSREEWASITPGLWLKDARGTMGEVTSRAPHYLPGEINVLVVAGGQNASAQSLTNLFVQKI